MPMEPIQRLCVGAISGPHGVRGLVRVHSFMADPGALCAYGSLTDAEGDRAFQLALTGRTGVALIVRIDGVRDRDGAVALKGQKLYLDRRLLPAITEADAFYHADLIGLEVRTPAGVVLGRVLAVHDFGAGDILEIGTVLGDNLMVPFTRWATPIVDLGKGMLIVAPEAHDPATASAERTTP